MEIAGAIATTIAALNDERQRLVERLAQTRIEIKKVDQMLKVTKALIPAAGENVSPGLEPGLQAYMLDRSGTPRHVGEIVEALEYRGVVEDTTYPTAAVTALLFGLAASREAVGATEGIYRVHQNTWVWEDRVDGTPGAKTAEFLRQSPFEDADSGKKARKR